MFLLDHFTSDKIKLSEVMEGCGVMNHLKKVEKEKALASRQDLNESAKEVFENIFAQNTHKAYKSDLRDFRAYLDHHGLTIDDVTDKTIINYLDCLRLGKIDYLDDPDARPRKFATIQRRLISIRFLFKNYRPNKPNPANAESVKQWIKGLRKTIGTAQKQKRAATKNIIRALLIEIDGNRLIDIRNRAIIALGYAGAFRRSELVQLDIDDLEFDNEGLYVTLRRSKTDQEGKGIRKYIYYADQSAFCPVRSVQRWIKAANVTHGALFRRISKGGKVGDRISDKAIYDIVRDTAKKAGFDQKEFGGHSLRRGLITQLAKNGVEERHIMAHTGHRSVLTVRSYIEDGNIKKKSPTKEVL